MIIFIIITNNESLFFFILIIIIKNFSLNTKKKWENSIVWNLVLIYIDDDLNVRVLVSLYIDRKLSIII